MAASDKTLGDLHEQVAAALTEQVKGYEDEKIDFKPNGESVVTKVKVRPSPALLGAAITFLKNNNITASAEEDSALKELGKQLAARRDKRIPQKALDEAASHFSHVGGDIPGMVQ